MLKKLTIAFFTLLLCAKVNSQTKLYNDDGSFRTDGFYLVKMCEIPLIAKANSVIQFPQTYKKWGTYRQQYPNAYAYPYKSIIAFRFYKNNYAQLIMKQQFYWEMQSFFIGDFNNNDDIIKTFTLYNDKIPTNENYEFIHAGSGNGNGRSWQTFVKSWNYKEFDFFVNFTYDFKKNLDPIIKYNSKFTLNRNDKKVYYQLEEDSQVIFKCESPIVEFIQSDKLNEDIILAEKQKRDEFQAKAQKEWEIKQEKNRLLAIEFEKNRKLKLKSATIGDRICFSQDWTHSESSSGFFGIGAYENKVSYKMMIICYIERIEGTKMQVRVANVESSNKNQYSTPDYKGVKMTEGSIHWVNPYTDTNWLFCE